MKKWLILTMVVVLVAGCNQTSQERLEGLANFLGVAKAESEKTDEYIAALQLTLENLDAQLDDPGLPQGQAERIREAFAQAKLTLSVAVDKKIEIDKVIAETETLVAEIAARPDVNFGDELQAAAATLQTAAQAIPSQWGVYVGMVGTLLGLIGGVVAKRTKGALVDVVRSVDKERSKMPQETGDAFVAGLGNSQLPTTRTIVRSLPRPYKPISIPPMPGVKPAA